MHPSTDNRSKQATEIHRSAYRVCLVIAYTTLAVFSWTIIVFLTHRPITTRYYDDGYPWDAPESNYRDYNMNERWYNAARVIQAIVAILGLPLISTVCSSAAVIYAQRCRPTAAEDRFNIRQLMMLADKGWADLRKIWKTLTAKNGWKRCGSGFLVVAMVLNVMGLIIQPIQEIFLSSTTVKTPTDLMYLSSLPDIPDKFPGSLDIGSSMVSTRKALETNHIDQVQSLLWSGSNISCSTTSPDGKFPEACDSGGLSLRNMSQLPYAFLAPVPNGYHTGLQDKQFVPRINSTASVRRIAAADYPADCDNIAGAYNVQYSNTSVDQYEGNRSWTLRACMPGDYVTPRWKGTRDQQNFTEELYIEFTTQAESTDSNRGPIVNNHQGVRLHVQLTTTAGYFELPNYSNGLTAGPLLDRNPGRLCDGFCSDSNMDSNAPPRETAPGINEALFDIYPELRTPEFTPNKGPLQAIALALFGPGSLPYRLLNAPSLYINPMLPSRPNLCVDKAPLGGLILPLDGAFDDPTIEDNIIRSNVCIEDGDESHSMDIVPYWLANFNARLDVLSNVFTAAAFLANQAWMFDNEEGRSLQVYFDPGADSLKPTISRTGVVVVSVLLGVQLAVLMGLALYAWVYPRWTDELDSMAMMRIGNVLARAGVRVGLVGDGDALRVLDDMSGRIGDSLGDQAVGSIALGGEMPLRGSKWYRVEGCGI